MCLLAGTWKPESLQPVCGALSVTLPPGSFISCYSACRCLPQAWYSHGLYLGCTVQVPLLISKVHREVLSWSYSDVIAGRHLGGDLVKVPTRFNGLQHYCGVFKELLLAELQASLLQVTEQAYRTSTHMKVPTASIVTAAWVHSAVHVTEAACIYLNVLLLPRGPLARALQLSHFRQSYSMCSGHAVTCSITPVPHAP